MEIKGKSVPHIEHGGPEWEKAMLELDKEAIVQIFKKKIKEQEKSMSLVEELRRQKIQLIEALNAETATIQQRLIAELMGERDKAAEALKDVQAILWGVNPDVQKALDIATEGLKP